MTIGDSIETLIGTGRVVALFGEDVVCAQVEVTEGEGEEAVDRTIYMRVPDGS